MLRTYISMPYRVLRAVMHTGCVGSLVGWLYLKKGGFFAARQEQV